MARALSPAFIQPTACLWSPWMTCLRASHVPASTACALWCALARVARPARPRAWEGPPWGGVAAAAPVSNTSSTEVRLEWRRAGVTGARGCPGYGSYSRCGQPRPSSLLGRAGRPHLACVFDRELHHPLHHVGAQVLVELPLEGLKCDVVGVLAEGVGKLCADVVDTWSSNLVSA